MAAVHPTGKYRCPLSGKLFREENFVRKHIDNKHSDKLSAAKRAALEPKYLQYYSVEAERVAAMPPLPPPPPRFSRDMDDSKSVSKTQVRHRYR